jgi:hypothetical protein
MRLATCWRRPWVSPGTGRRCKGQLTARPAASSVQVQRSRKRDVWCGAVRWCRSVDERLSHSEAGTTSALLRGEPRALYWSETTALYARTITFAAYSNGRQACPQGWRGHLRSSRGLLQDPKSTKSRASVYKAVVSGNPPSSL